MIVKRHILAEALHLLADTYAAGMASENLQGNYLTAGGFENATKRIRNLAARIEAGDDIQLER